MTKWGMLIDLKRCAGCGACVVACQLQNNQGPGTSWVKLDAIEWGEDLEDSGRVYLPHACMHCENPECVVVCPTGASQKLEDGVVIVDYDACIACGLCLEACSYSARVLNEGKGNYFGASTQAPYESYGVQREHVAEKCIFCHDRVSEGFQTACVLNCPAQARFFGDLDDAESEVSKRIALGDANRIDETSFYYVPVKNMSPELLPSATPAQTIEPAKAEPGINLAAATAGVAAVAVVGSGVAVGLKKSSKRSKAQKQTDIDKKSIPGEEPDTTTKNK